MRKNIRVSLLPRDREVADRGTCSLIALYNHAVYTDTTLLSLPYMYETPHQV